MAAVAAVALAVGAGVAAVVTSEPSSSPSATPAPRSSAPVNIPGGGGQAPGGGAAPGSGTIPGGGQAGQLLIGGKVAAISSMSITIGTGAHAVTAAVTSSTRVTGKVTSIGSVKVGDLVSAQITESGGRATATAIQDPARLPRGLPPLGGSQP